MKTANENGGSPNALPLGSIPNAKHEMLPIPVSSPFFNPKTALSVTSKAFPKVFGY